ncbi:MAG: ferritin-like domain-containing protein [Nannocystaceae bacterium]|nr:bacterioferritin [bacterium]
MKTSPKVAELLHELMLRDLLASEVYHVQAVLLRDMGLLRLADHFEHESLHERQHADWQLERLTFLGVPIDLSKRPQHQPMGSTAKSFIEGSLKMELGVAKTLRELCEAAIGDDEGTYLLAQRLLEETETDHIYWLEKQLTLIEQVGEENYLAQMLEPADAGA